MIPLSRKPPTQFAGRRAAASLSATRARPSTAFLLLALLLAGTTTWQLFFWAAPRAGGRSEAADKARRAADSTAALEDALGLVQQLYGAFQSDVLGSAFLAASCDGVGPQQQGQDEGDDPRAAWEKGGSNAGASPGPHHVALQRLNRLLRHLAQDGFVAPCRDAAADGSASSSSYDLAVCEARGCTIAINLHDSEGVLPNLIVQVVRLAAMLGPGNLLISVYESGSRDGTALWLALLRLLLRELGVAHVIETSGASRPPGPQDRIEFLASMRQAAVDQAVALCASLAADGRGDRPPYCERGGKLVFANDVYFEASDVVRLLQYGGSGGDGGRPAAADLACGMDFEPILADLPTAADQHAAMADHLNAHLHVPAWLAQRLAASSLALRLWKRSYRRHDSLLQLLPLSFYDVWVARDVSGGRFTRPAPYTTHGPTAELLRAGRPAPVYCCWNGLVAVLDALPLLQHEEQPGSGSSDAGDRLRFRSHAEGECAASECSLLCDDLRRVGRGRVVVDPGVRVTYRRWGLRGSYCFSRRVREERRAACGARVQVCGAKRHVPFCRVLVRRAQYAPDSHAFCVSGMACVVWCIVACTRPGGFSTWLDACSS